jgi:hypothetical protein
MAKAAFNKQRTLFTNTLDLELRKKLVKCYIWSIALYGAETWTLRAASRPARPRTHHDSHHDTMVKPEAATAVIELRMMGGKTPETC